MSISNYAWPVSQRIVSKIVAAALEEDVGRGDVTTLACIPDSSTASGQIVAKQAGVLSGLYVVQECFGQMSADVQVMPVLWEGDEFDAGDALASVRGPTRAILSAERVALNFLQRLCGIATITREYVRAVEGTACRILDTRKTTPGLRALEKAAVRAGGGGNHRFALYDGYLIKDNHIAACGSITAAVEAVRRAKPPTATIEVEVQNFEQLEEALACGVDVIMLDNMTPEQVARAVEIVGGRALVEASGGITADSAGEYARAGVDFISAGALTHSAPAIDISLELSGDE